MRRALGGSYRSSIVYTVNHNRSSEGQTMSQHFNMRVGANAVIVRDDAILLVEFGNGWKRHFNLPGRGIEPGESIVDGLRREVREETCAEITVGSLVLALE
jgi:ADP-ribose pyrophosphatase YjhB (NUDIX family)